MGKSVLPWSVRLKIGKEIANAVTYLHMAFPKITIHRDIKPSNIFLDKNWTAKLSDFSLSITLPEGKSRIEAELWETVGYLDPLYSIFSRTHVVTEYTDVYNFGVSLLVFLTGRQAHIRYEDMDVRYIASYVKDLYDNGKLDEVIDPMMAKDITSSQRLQVEACVVLALRCCKARDEERPKMIQIDKELKRIERIESSLDVISGFIKPEMLEVGSTMALSYCKERDEDRPEMIQVAKELKRIEQIEPPQDAKSGFLKPENLRCWKMGQLWSSGQRNSEARLRSCSY